MSDKPQVPRPEDIINPGIEKLLALRPKALKGLNDPDGRYHQVFLGLRAQAALMLRRIADAVRNGRVKFAEGAALRALIENEFGAIDDFGPTKAVGLVVLTRPGTTLGVIKKGTKFKRNATSAYPVPFGDATYESTADVLATGNFVRVPVVAQATGKDSNILQFSTEFIPDSGFSVADRLFDTTFTVFDMAASGGSDGISDDTLREYAKAFFRGQYAPTEAALRAGALAGNGVGHVAVLDDYEMRQSTLFIADQSWTANDEWFKTVRTSMVANLWPGFGARFGFLEASNQSVAATATIALVDNASFDFTGEITAAVQAVISDYLNNRPDWYLWKTTALRARIAHAHDRILTCSSASLLDHATGTPLAEPTLPSAPFALNPLPLHYFLVNNGVQLTFTSPT